MNIMNPTNKKNDKKIFLIIPCGEYYSEQTEIIKSVCRAGAYEPVIHDYYGKLKPFFMFNYSPHENLK